MSAWDYEKAVQQKFAYEERVRREFHAREVARRNAREHRLEMARDLTAQERADLAEKLIKAMNAGDVEPWRLSVFDRDPLGALTGILPRVAERWGLPQCQSEVLAKASAEPGGFLGTGLDREEVSERIQLAWRNGAIPSSVLSQFDADPLKVLQTLPESVCKSFSIPRPFAVHEPLRKGHMKADQAAGVQEPLRKSGRNADLEDAVNELRRCLVG